SAREFSYWDGEELIGVGIADETPHALSAVYCYSDPARRHLSTATYTVWPPRKYARYRRPPSSYPGSGSGGCACREKKGAAGYEHDDEGPDDMPSHIRAALTRTAETLPVSGGDLALGTWQAVYLWEHRRAPHRRTMVVTVWGV